MEPVRRDAQSAGEMRAIPTGNPSPQAVGLPRFTPEFIAEVGDCDGLDSFRDLLDRRGLWLNQQAALDVYGYLRSLAPASSEGQALPDERLADVVGGVTTNPLESPTLMPLLAEVARQL